MTLDTLYQVNTPEGIALRLSPAGPVPRMLAWSIDILIRLGINIIIYIIFAFLGKTGLGIALILTFLLEWFYPVYFELFKQGQTPGKKAFNLYVSMENASPITPAASIIRNLLRFVDFLPLFYGFGFISMLLTKRFQRLGDLVAGTVVLHQTHEQPVFYGEEVAASPPAFSLQLREQQALIRFQQRVPYIAKERAEELACLTSPLINISDNNVKGNAQANDKENTTKNATEKLLSIASWIMGHRGSTK